MITPEPAEQQRYGKARSALKLSRYLKVYPLEQEPEKLLLYSTEKTSLVKMSRQAYALLAAGSYDGPDRQRLCTLGILTEKDPENEIQTMLEAADRAHRAVTKLQATVVLNLDCNFDCVYCYEAGIRNRQYMSSATASHLVDFLKARFGPEQKILRVDFYGGEPLLSMELVTAVSRRLKLFAEGRGGDYRFSLGTNGSLLTRRVARELVPLGLDGVKVTLDGPRHVHNRYRPFRGGTGSFDTIIANIKDTCDLVPVTIGGNYDRESFRAFEKLLDFLQQTGLTPETIKAIRFDPIMARPDRGQMPIDACRGCISVGEPWIAEAGLLLREAILDRGYGTPKLRPTHCMVELQDACVVHVDGGIYKCPAFIGIDRFRIGSLQGGTMDRDYVREYKPGRWKNKTCTQCTYLPLCFGGCRYLTYLQKGTLQGCDCKKGYYERSLDVLLNQDIRHRCGAGGRPEVTTGDGPPDLSGMFQRLMEVIRHCLPRLAGSFVPPSLERIIQSYYTIDGVVGRHVFGKPDQPRNRNGFNAEAFYAVAGVRFVDDFIDTTLWPRLREFERRGLAVAFERLLLEALEVVRAFDPAIPDRILELPRLEMRLVLWPSQESFDQNFRQLFAWKSFDMLYIYRRIHGTAESPLEDRGAVWLALMEYVRDFSAESIAVDTDLNLYTYLRDNRINPSKMLDYFRQIYNAMQERTSEDASCVPADCACGFSPEMSLRHDLPGKAGFQRAAFPRMYLRALKRMQTLCQP